MAKVLIKNPALLERMISILTQASETDSYIPVIMATKGLPNVEKAQHLLSLILKGILERA